MGNHIEILSEHYRWHEATAEIVDIRDGSRVQDSEYSAKVAVYEDRTRTWFLNVALRATAAGPSPEDYVALSIALAYLEGVEQYRQGQITPLMKSGEWFKISAKRIFPKASSQAIERLWKVVRNGLFHTGFTKGPTLLSYDHAEALTIDGRYLYINPATFVKAVVADFDTYVEHLQSNAGDNLAQRFEMLWDAIWKET